MSSKLISEYKSIANKYDNIIFLEERNILKYLIMADIMISDTSSVVFEFLLLNKPVITYKSIKPKNAWENINDDKLLSEKIQYNLNEDPYAVQRAKIIEEYHPYNDGKLFTKNDSSYRKLRQRKWCTRKKKLAFTKEI